MGWHDRLAIKANLMNKNSKEFTGAAQRHANASWFFLIIAGVVWYFSDNWVWTLIPLALMTFTVLQSISSTLIASKLEAYEPNDQKIGNQDTEKVVNEFGQVMENLDWLLAFHDVKKLPYPKETVLNAIVSAYQLTADQNMKEILKSGLLALSHFQENIGEAAVKGAVDLTQINIDELSPEKYLAMNEGIDKEKYEYLSQQADKEYQGYIELL